MRPDYDLPELPDDLTLVSDSEVMQLFAHAVAWQNFAATVAVEREVKEAELEAQIAFAEAQAVLASWESAPVTTGARGATKVEFTATVARAQREASPQVQSLKSDLRGVYASRKRAQVVRDNAERIANVVSRELTRRVGRDPVERKAQRYVS